MKRRKKSSGGTGSKKADSLINSMIEGFKKEGDFNQSKVEELRKELVAAVKEDYSDSDIEKITKRDLSEIFDSSIDLDKYWG